MWHATSDISLATDLLLRACQVVQIFWNGLMTEVMMTAFLMSAEPDDGTPLSPILRTSSSPIPTLTLTLTLT